MGRGIAEKKTVIVCVTVRQVSTFDFSEGQEGGHYSFKRLPGRTSVLLFPEFANLTSVRRTEKALNTNIFSQTWKPFPHILHRIWQHFLQELAKIEISRLITASHSL